MGRENEVRCIWEIECVSGGLGAVIKADSHEEMVRELKRIGFESVLNEEAQKTYIIDVMCAIVNGKEYMASEYVPPHVIINDVKTLPETKDWPK
jgi:hypothetical protein